MIASLVSLSARSSRRRRWSVLFVISMHYKAKSGEGVPVPHHTSIIRNPSCGFGIHWGLIPASADRRSHRGWDPDIHQAKHQVPALQLVALEHLPACLGLAVPDQADCSDRLERLVEWSREFPSRSDRAKASACVHAAVHDDYADKDRQDCPNGEASNQGHAALPKSLSEWRSTSINSISPVCHDTSHVSVSTDRKLITVSNSSDPAS